MLLFTCFVYSNLTSFTSSKVYIATLEQYIYRMYLASKALSKNWASSAIELIWRSLNAQTKSSSTTCFLFKNYQGFSAKALHFQLLATISGLQITTSQWRGDQQDRYGESHETLWNWMWQAVYPATQAETLVLLRIFINASQDIKLEFSCVIQVWMCCSVGNGWK